MKKLISLTLAVIMITAILASAAAVNSYETETYWIDWYRVNGAQIAVNTVSAGNIEKVTRDNSPTYVKHDSDPDNDTVLLLGWVLLKDSKEIKGYGYKIDEEAVVYSNDFFYDRPDVKALYSKAEGYCITFNYNGLSAGDHTVSLAVKGDDNKDDLFYTYKFTVAPDGSAESAYIVNTFVDDQYMTEDGVITVVGWTGANYEIEDIGYKIDSFEPVFGDGSVTVIQLQDNDPVKEKGNAGKYGVRFTAEIDTETFDLPDGMHRLELVAKIKDENSTVLSIHTMSDGEKGGAIGFMIGQPYEVDESDEKENDVWLCERQEPFATGWWIFPDEETTVEEYEIYVEFDSPTSFEGFVLSCFAGSKPITLQVSLLDENGDALEERSISVSGDHHSVSQGFIKIIFDNAYAAGSYAIQFLYEYPGADKYSKEYFVLSSGKENDTYAIATGLAGPDTLDAPAIRLLYAEIPEDTGADTDGTVTDPDESAKDPDGSETDPDESTKDPDESATDPDESKAEPDDSETKPGDAPAAKDVDGDGEANNKDVVYLFRYVSKGDAEYDVKFDIDGDGEVNNKDVVILFRALSEMDKAPAETSVPDDPAEESKE